MFMLEVDVWVESGSEVGVASQRPQNEEDFGQVW